MTGWLTITANTLTQFGAHALAVERRLTAGNNPMHGSGEVTFFDNGNSLVAALVVTHKCFGVLCGFQLIDVNSGCGCVQLSSSVTAEFKEGFVMMGICEQESWVANELETIDLRDKRLDRRLVGLLKSLSSASTASIPAACSGRSEMVAAYRFFDNPKVEFENVLAPHIDATYCRIAQQPIALLVHDTTELDLTRPDSVVQGVGPLHHGDRVGAHLHELHAFSIDGVPLGTVSAEAWTREPKSDKLKAKRGASEKRVANAQKSIEEKESFRWLDTAAHCEEVKEHCPDTQLIMIADSESDISDVLGQCSEQTAIDWIIRSGYERIIHKTTPGEPSVSLRERLLNQRERYRDEVNVRSRSPLVSDDLAKKSRRKSPRDPRSAEVAVRAASIRLNDPRAGRTGGIAVNAVMVRELNVPIGEEPIEWILLTSLPIRTNNELKQIIYYYTMRWLIELFFKILKSGCRIESRRFEHIDRFLPALATYMIVAWRSFYVCRVSRTHGDESCEILYSEAEWKSAWSIVKQEQPPKKAPPLYEMTCVIAELGGYVNRKNVLPPGPQTIWIGLQRMHDIATCWTAFGPGANKTCV
jgi:hypothetical protein